jgi:hypothetical protein
MMKIGRAIKKPISVEFILLQDKPDVIFQVYKFIHGEDSIKNTCKMAEDKWDEYSDNISKQGYISLKTLESGDGTQNASIGDYILKGIDGECWPIKANIFNRTYTII